MVGSVADREHRAMDASERRELLQAEVVYGDVPWWKKLWGGG